MNGFTKRIAGSWSRASEHDISLIAAGIAYYAFLAMVPLLAVVVLAYGLLADAQTVAGHLGALTDNLPPAAAELIGSQLESVTGTRAGAKGFGLVAALALALFSARGGAMAIITAMNDTFDAESTRGAIKANLVAMGLTAGAVLALGLVAVAMSLAALFSGPLAGLAGYAVVALAGFVGAMLLYRIAPHDVHPPARSIRQGATVFALGWVVASALFGYYVANFGNYNATYGALSAIVVLLTWLYLSAFLLLFGAHFAASRSRGDEG